MEYKIFYKYKNISTKESYKYLIDSLVNKYLYFSRPNELNDPFDCFIPKHYVYNSEQELKKFVETANNNKNTPKKTSVEYMKERLKKKEYEKLDYLFTNHLHVLSLSESWKLETMWGRYTDNYKGICIGYKTLITDNQNYLEIDSPIADILYSDWMQIINDKKYFLLEKVHYNNDGKHKFNIFNPNIDCIQYNIFHKKEIWADELEYRIFIHDNENDLIDDKDGLFNKISYPDTSLSEILFGYKMPAYEMKIIYDFITNLYKNASEIKFFIVQPDFEKYELQRKKYTPPIEFNVFKPHL